jgi:hypothetical protein
MLSSRKPVAALAAVTAALAIAIPAASANAAPAASPVVDPTVCQLLNFTQGPFGPGIFIGDASLTDTLTHAGDLVGCTPPAPEQGLMPFGPAFP